MCGTWPSGVPVFRLRAGRATLALRRTGRGLMLLLALLLGCSHEAGTTSTAEAAVAPALRTVAAEAVAWRPQIELTGSLDPVASVQLGFDVPGRIQSILVERGQRVEKGAAIARLDGAIAEAQLAQAEAAHAGASAQLAGGESALQRVQQLDAAGGVSKQTLTDAEAGVKAGRAGVEQAAAAVRLARTNLGFHTLKAPIAGTVTNGPDNAGILIGAGNPLFVIEDLSALQVKATAPESATWLREGQPAIVLPGTPGEVAGVPASVVRVIPSLDPATRRIPVEIRIESPPPSLKAHGFARVRVESDTDVAAIAVPRDAVVARPEFCVFVTDGGTPKKIGVEVLDYQGEKVIVQGIGLTAGATVVVDPPNGLGDDE